MNSMLRRGGGLDFAKAHVLCALTPSMPAIFFHPSLWPATPQFHPGSLRVWIQPHSSPLTSLLHISTCPIPYVSTATPVTGPQAPSGHGPHSSSQMPSARPQISFTERRKEFCSPVGSAHKVPMYGAHTTQSTPGTVHPWDHLRSLEFA